MEIASRTSGFAVRRADYLDLRPAGWGRALKLTYARQLTYAPAAGGLSGLEARGLDVGPLSEHGVNGDGRDFSALSGRGREACPP